MDDFVEINADDTKLTTANDVDYSEFLTVYERIRSVYGDEHVGLVDLPKLPSIADMCKVYEGVDLPTEAVLKRRWIVATELAMLDAIIRDKVAFQKYLDSTEDQRFLFRAIDHFTKDDTHGDQWDVDKWGAVLAVVSDDDDYDLGKTAIFEDRVFHYRLCKDMTFPMLFVEKFKEEDLERTAIAPLNPNVVQK